MNNKDGNAGKKLIGFVEKLCQQCEKEMFTLENLQACVPVPMRWASNNRYIDFYEAPAFQIGAEETVTGLDARIFRDARRRVGLLVLDISGTQLTAEGVGTYFPTLVLGEMPRGDSIHEKIYYRVPTSWGKVSFGFDQMFPNRLSSVVFDPVVETGEES